MLPANNIWNMPVDELPLDPNSDTYVSTIGATANLFPDFWNATGGMYLNVVDATQPRVPIVGNYFSQFDPGPFPIPAGAVVQQASDAHLMVLDSGNCKLYEAWQAAPVGDGSWATGVSTVFDMNSNTERPAGWTAADAAGMAMMPGAVTYDEVMSGQITHAIGMTVPATAQRYI